VSGFLNELENPSKMRFADGIDLTEYPLDVRTAVLFYMIEHPFKIGVAPFDAMEFHFKHVPLF
jgi:hypothetical protein